jgi:hypothetical protein
VEISGLGLSPKEVLYGSATVFQSPYRSMRNGEPSVGIPIRKAKTGLQLCLYVTCLLSPQTYALRTNPQTYNVIVNIRDAFH